MSPKNDNQAPDPRLVKLIQLLRPVPERNPQAIEHGRMKFEADLDEIFSEPKTHPASPLSWILGREKIKAPRRLRPRLAFTTIMIIITLVVFLAGGAGLTVYAAQKALPGDALYPVKTRVEQTRITLTSDHYRLATMQLALAEERLDEIEALIQDKRFDLVGDTAAEFERHIQMALEAVQQLANEDPGRASQLSVQITEQLNRYIQALNEMVNKLPDEVKAEVEQSIANSTDLGNLPETEDHGELNVNEQKNTNEPEQGDTNLNDNSNENEQPENEANTNEAETLTPEGINQNQNDNGNEVNDGAEFSFTGQVEKISPQAWMVSGTEFVIGPNTRIEPGITVGAKVEIKALQPAGQPAEAIEIKLSEEENINGSDNSNDNQVVENQNSNESTGENRNTSGGDNANSNTNSNDNLNNNDNSHD